MERKSFKKETSLALIKDEKGIIDVMMRDLVGSLILVLGDISIAQKKVSKKKKKILR